MDADDFRLPDIYPYLKIYKAPDNQSSGEPVWTLHDPLANTYFRLDWMEFECISRFATVGTAKNLVETVNRDTTLTVGVEDIKRIVSFLEQNGLTAGSRKNTTSAPSGEQKIWQKILHGYLYFMLPLWRPQKFLERFLPMVEPILSTKAASAMAVIFIIACFLTVQRMDEFLSTFTGLFSFEGLLKLGIVFAVVKIVHEMAHAFTAVKNKIHVPHMGIAFIVMYPVLYTETTGGWQLDNRKSRMEIGFAGVRAELFLATLSLLFWNIFPAGSTAQSLCFLVVAVSMISSLAVNLNPLMRFDGYYILSDYMGIENLQNRSCAFARWKLRRILFAINDAPPETIEKELENFLLIFGFALLIYRFFLFTGIAIFVYHVFFKPLGFIMMMIELWLFVMRPIVSELQIWNARRHEIWQEKRSRYIAYSFGIICLLTVLPIHRTVDAPAISHALHYTSVYPSAPAMITDIYIQEGDTVKKGEVLLVLKSPSLQHDFEIAAQRLDALRILKQRANLGEQGSAERNPDIESDIRIAEEKVKSVQSQIDRLIVVAPFDGKVRDVLSDMNINRGVMATDLLFRIIDDTKEGYTAYIPESDIGRISEGDKGVFIPDGQPFLSVPLLVQKISPANSNSFDEVELSSCFGGTIPSRCDAPSGETQMVPLRNIYRVNLESVTSLPPAFYNNSVPGVVRIEGRRSSPFVRFITSVIGKITSEAGL